MYESILVPTDGSEHANAALTYALDLANTYGAGLHTVYVVDTRVGADAGLVGTLDALERAGETALDRVVQASAEAGVGPVESSVIHGTPSRAIVEYVEEHEIDLIVMSTHGRTGLNRYLLGSVTEKVVRMSPIPVLTIPGSVPTE